MLENRTASVVSSLASGAANHLGDTVRDSLRIFTAFYSMMCPRCVLISFPLEAITCFIYCEPTVLLGPQCECMIAFVWMCVSVCSILNYTETFDL